MDQKGSKRIKKDYKGLQRITKDGVGEVIDPFGSFLNFLQFRRRGFGGVLMCRRCVCDVCLMCIRCVFDVYWTCT